MRGYWLVTGFLVILATCGGQRNGNLDVQVTWGLDIINAVVTDKQNVLLPILKCKFDGFVEDVSEYRAWAAKRKDASAKLTATVPCAGTYYPAFIFYDTAGDERIGISINGKHVGTALANMDDNRQKLFYLYEPRTFQGGETIELRALTAAGQYKTEDLLLLKQRPQPKHRTYTISDIRARVTAKTATITWLTDWPAAATVQTDDPNVKALEELALNNHRVRLDHLVGGRKYRFRIVAQSPDRQTIASEWQTFQTEAPAAVTGSVRKERVALKLEKGELPVTVGVPFAEGALGSDEHLRLVNSSSQEIPLQTRVLQRWPDGSVRWILLDFAGKQSSAVVEYGTEVRRGRAQSLLRVTESDDTVKVGTGALTFTVSKRRFGLFDAVWYNSEKIVDKPAEFSLTGPDGKVYTSLAAPDEVVLEDSGPVRAVVRVTGRHQTPDGKKLFRYILRLHAWAGQPYVRIQHTLENDNLASDFTDVKSLTLRAPLAGVAKRWAFAGTAGSFSASAAVTLQQRTDDRFTIQPLGVQGKRAAGWAEWNDGSHTVTLAIRDFWQNYPKDLKVSAGGFELALLPFLRPDEYDSAKGTMDEHRIYYYLQGGAYKLRQGVTKTHDVWLEFGGKGPGAIRDEQQVRMASVPPEWYQRAKVFGEISVPRASEVFRQYDDAFAQTFASYLRDRETNRGYGMLNFGDWWGESAINWGNSEYDTQHAFLLQFARTGDWRYFRAAEEIEWHNRDVDAIHHARDPVQLGAVYAHTIGHVGDYYINLPTAGAPAGGFDRGSSKSHFAVDHTFIEGHFDYYFLTGDRRSYETALRAADRYESYFTRNYDFNNCRQPGWHLILSMAAYNATNDPYYLNAAKMIVDRVLERQTPDGGWKRQMVPGHCLCTPRHQGNAGFMVGVLLTGLRHYYETTGDSRVADSIVKGAHFLVNEMWIPEVRGFRYTSCPKSSVGPWSNFLLFDGIVFAYRRTGDPRLLDVLAIGTDGALQTMTRAKRASAAWGKGFTQYTRVVPHFLDHLAALKENARAKGTE